MISSASDSSETSQRKSPPAESASGSPGSAGNNGSGRREGGYHREGGYRQRDGAGQGDRPKAGAMEVTVDHNIERAMKVLKRKLIREGLFKELKARRYYEKPSERKKRKHKEALKKARKEEARQRRSSQLL